MSVSTNGSNDRLSRTNRFAVSEAIALARDIQSRFPEKDQSILWQALMESAEDLSPEEKIRAVFSLVMPVLSEEVRIESLFALARVAKRRQVAYATAAILRAMRLEGIREPAGLVDFGLVELRINKHGKFYLCPLLREERLIAAQERMAAKGMHKGARAIGDHLMRVRDYKNSRQKSRQSADTTASTQEQTEFPDHN